MRIFAPKFCGSCSVDRLQARGRDATSGRVLGTSDFGLRPSFGFRPSGFGLILVRAFSLIEVMIACGIFFMATFAILALVSTTLRNARGLQRGDVDAVMAAAQVYETLKTNRQAEVSGSGNFGENYPDYSYEFASQQ